VNEILGVFEDPIKIINALAEIPFINQGFAWCAPVVVQAAHLYSTPSLQAIST
jgi:hypothetical protein